jgi:hypothetical protein
VRSSARSARRSGGRPSNVRRRPQPAPASQLAAAEVIAQDVEANEPAEAAAELAEVAGTTPARRRGKAGGLLAARAATEYLYVAQDMRRILAVAGGLFATLIVLWVLIVALRVIPLPFY